MSSEFEVTMDRSKFIGKPLSECPPGVSGCPTVTEEQTLNQVADAGIKMLEASDVVARIIVPKGFTVPETLNALTWVRPFNQGAIGSCNLASGLTLLRGLHFVKTNGELIDYSVFFGYMICQWMDRLLGRDSGSLPSTLIKMLMKFGALPVTYPGVPKYPTSYSEGLRTHKQLFDEFMREYKNPNGPTPIMDAMAEHKLKTFIRVKTPDQAQQLMRKGVAQMQKCGPWVSGFDRDPARMFLDGELHGKHGLHAYSAADTSPDLKDLVDLNSWGSGTGKDAGVDTGGQGWGDESYKNMSMELAREYFQHPHFCGQVLTDMEFPAGQSVKCREIPYVATNWG